MGIIPIHALGASRAVGASLGVFEIKCKRQLFAQAMVTINDTWVVKAMDIPNLSGDRPSPMRNGPGIFNFGGGHGDLHFWPQR